MKPNQLDNGAVLAQTHFQNTNETYIGDVYKWVDEKLPELFSKAINGLSNGSITPKPQNSNPDLALRCYPRRPENGRIDWKDSSKSFHRLICSSSRTLSGIYTTLEGVTRITIWRAEKFNHPGEYSAVPGQILYQHEDDPLIACGSGVVNLTGISL